MRNFIFFLTLITVFASCKKDEPMQQGKIPEDPCPGVPLRGNLSYNDSTKTYLYVTKGGGIVLLGPASLKFQHIDYENFTFELWGGYIENGISYLSFYHENLNGKHIKNKIGNHRTILFPDGAKVTLVAENDTAVVSKISIYDGADCFELDMLCNRILKYSSSDASVTQARDNAEVDGETCTFDIDETGLLLYNIYTEDEPGIKVEDIYNLGEFFFHNPYDVKDYYDDPRLGWT